jgi:hypothetical protein
MGRLAEAFDYINRPRKPTPEEKAHRYHKVDVERLEPIRKRLHKAGKQEVPV